MAMVKEIPVYERPREKAMRFGIESLSNRELLAMLLRSGIPGHSVLEISDILLHRAGGLQGLVRMDRGQLCAIPGISAVKSLELQASFELSKRVMTERVMEKAVVQRPQDLIRWLRQSIAFKPQENFMAVYLDTANHVLLAKTLFIGTLDTTTVSAREVFREALLQGASGVILVHNHPSGELAPSPHDIACTRKLVQAGRIMNVRVLDHIIVSSEGFLSLGKEGLMETDMQLFD